MRLDHDYFLIATNLTRNNSERSPTFCQIVTIKALPEKSDHVARYGHVECAPAKRGK